jgi:hypothetical protein
MTMLTSPSLIIIIIIIIIIKMYTLTPNFALVKNLINSYNQNKFCFLSWVFVLKAWYHNISHNCLEAPMTTIMSVSML